MPRRANTYYFIRINMHDSMEILNCQLKGDRLVKPHYDKATSRYIDCVLVHENTILKTPPDWYIRKNAFGYWKEDQEGSFLGSGNWRNLEHD